jgi:uncharacterized protein YbjT (DUF2867 family)
MILVAGATGLVGSEVCRRLVGRGREVRALVRETSDAGKKKALQECGATLVTGDLKDRGSLIALPRRYGDHIHGIGHAFAAAVRLDRSR